MLAYQSGIAKFNGMDVQVLAISTDFTPTLKHWKETELKAEFPMLSDHMRKVAEQYGILIAQMGIAAEINAKAAIVEQGFTAERLVSGEADLAVQQISELKQVEGIEVVGPVPHDLQTPAVFSAGRMANAEHADTADRLLRYLASPEVVPVLRQSGLEP